MTEIIRNRLYMAGDYDADERLFDVIFDLTYDPQPSRKSWNQGVYIKYPFLDDTLDATTLRELHELTDFAVGAIRRGKAVLVHCNAGLNRSGLVTGMILCKLDNMPAKRAMQIIRIARNPLALCNDSFVKILELTYPEK